MTQPDFKYDKGKTRAALVLQDFPNALKKVAEVSTFGAQKYEAHSWLKVANAHQRYTDAMVRHLLEDMRGEMIDSESGLLHYAHFVWGALATLEMLVNPTNTKESE